MLHGGDGFSLIAEPEVAHDQPQVGIRVLQEIFPADSNPPGWGYLAQKCENIPVKLEPRPLKIELGRTAG